MFNFREEFEYIKKVRSDYYLYEAEHFLQGALESIKKMDFEGLKMMKTFDVHYSCEETSFAITADSNNAIGFVRFYKPEIGKKVFEKIGDIIGETYYYAMSKDKNSIHVQL